MLRALDSFHADGRFIAQGQELEASDPIVKKYPTLFARVDDAGIEQATAAPGERRTVTRARKAPAKKALPES